MSYNHQVRTSQIRVADAPDLLSIKVHSRERDRMSEEGKVSESNNVETLALKILLAVLIVHLTTYAYVEKVPLAINMLIAIRYILWIFTTIFFLYSAINNNINKYTAAISPFVPYFVIGIIAALAGFSMNLGFRQLIFWGLAVSASALVGLRLKPSVLLKTLFLIFAFMIVTSSIFAVLFPTLGTVADSRTASGAAWRGLFSGKNNFGEMCSYVLLLLLVVRDISWVVRIAIFGVAALALVKSQSQGAVIISAGMFGYWALVPVLRRLAIPSWSKPIALVASLLTAGGLIFVASGPLLALLGRDAKLSGRLDIWVAWLNRAMQSFWIGAGPGSFTTENSIVTADLSQAFQSYGAIYTPHNMYIAILGEVGIFGLLALVGPLIYMSMVLPFVRDGRMPFVCGMIAFTMAISGMPETREVFGLGLNMCLLVLAYAGAIQQSSQAGISRHSPSAWPPAKAPIP